MPDYPAPPKPDTPATAAEWAAMTFESIVIDPAAFRPAWDQERGEVARAVIALLRDDDKELTLRCAANDEARHNTLQMQQEIEREIDYLKTHIVFLETASMRLLCVASRAGGRGEIVSSRPPADLRFKLKDPAASDR